MSMFNRRNAVVGYLALRALKRARRNATMGYLAAQGVEHTRARRRGRHLLRPAVYVALGIVSAGVLAALAYFWRQRAIGSTAAGEELAGTAGEVAETTGDGFDASQDALAEVAADATAQAESVATDLAQAVESAPTT